MTEPTTAEIRESLNRNRPLTEYEMILLDRLEASELERNAAIQSAVVSEERAEKAEQTIKEISECLYLDARIGFKKGKLRERIAAIIGSKS